MLDLYESLAAQIKCPPGLKYLLPAIIPADDVPLLLGFSTWTETEAVARKLDIPFGCVEKKTLGFFRDGFIVCRGTSYKTRSFYGIVNTLMGEGRLSCLAADARAQIREYYMQSRLQIYDEYLAEGKLQASSRVLTLNEALAHHEHLHSRGKSMIVTTDEAFEILTRAHPLALVPCSCRLTFNNCGKPINTCINLNDSAEELLQRGAGQRITLAEGQEILAVAEREGLVHMAISAPDQPDYALCSCCRCCCHDLQALLRYGRQRWVQKARFVASDNPSDCTLCFICVERCVFDARKELNGRLSYDPNLCYGCGLCATSCPSKAICLKPRD